MANEVLDAKERLSIIFDVVDGIPSSGNEPEEVENFRNKIESDAIELEFSAEELGFNNVLFEYLSQG